MADITGQYTSPYSSPQFYHYISYSEIGRSGSSVSYRFTIESWMGSSGSSFGYSLGYELWVAGNKFTGTIKNASPSWTGTTHHYTTFDISVGMGSGGGLTSARLYVTRPNGDGNAGKLDTGDMSVTVSSWNTAPYFNGGWCSVSPSGTISENTSSLSVSWGGCYDTEGNTIYYDVYRVSSLGDVKIASGTTSTSLTDNIGGGNQGAWYKYDVYAHDGSLWADGKLTSNTVTKNVFTPSNISTSSSIGFSTSSISFSFSGIGNSNGNGSFGYSLSCNQVTVYNPSATPTSVTIYKSGALPSGTYIKFDDIKSVTSGGSYTGTFTFNLSSWNSYGSSGSRSCTMSIDLRISPTGFTVNAIGGYYTIPVGGLNYYIPDRKNLSISWSASTDQLGGSVTYDVQYQLGSGSFTTVLSNQTATSASISISGISGRTACVIRIVSKTSFGYTTTKDSVSITLDYYNPPTISFNTVDRIIDKATVSGIIKINTSIPNITVSSLTYSGKTSGSLTASTTFSKQETGLSEIESYTFTVTAQDQAGAVIGTSATNGSASVPKYSPMLSVREKGVGVNALADDTNKFVVGGNVLLSANNAWLTLDSSSSGANEVEQASGISIGESGYKGSASLHLTYTGDGYGHIGMGAVTNSVPANEAMTLFYTDNIVRFKTAPQVNGTSVSLNNHTHNLISPLSGDAQYKLAYTADGQRTNAGEWGRVVMRYDPNGQTYGVRVDRADYADSSGSANYANSAGTVSNNATVAELYNNGWYRSNGQTGWYSQTYGGGWYMTDSTWIRAYNDKSIYTTGNIQANGGISCYNISTAWDIVACYNGSNAGVAIGHQDEMWTYTMGTMWINYRIGSGLRVGNGSMGGLGAIYGSSKSAVVGTETYGEQILYCDESPTHVFHDSGHGVLDENGECYVSLDPILLETITTKQSDYLVFLTGFKGTNVEILEKHPDYFVVCGSPNKEFDWFLRAERKGMERLRFNEADISI